VGRRWSPARAFSYAAVLRFSLYQLLRQIIHIDWLAAGTRVRYNCHSPRIDPAGSEERFCEFAASLMSFSRGPVCAFANTANRCSRCFHIFGND
jgi:hypothetical protein